MKIGVNKATGIDNISAKILLHSLPVIAKNLRDVVNLMIKTGSFPDTLKLARVTPVYKKKAPQHVQNYRPVSIFPILSKLFERTLCEQLNEYFNKNIFHPYLSAFRGRCNCQSTLIGLTEYWRQAFDST